MDESRLRQVVSEHFEVLWRFLRRLGIPDGDHRRRCAGGSAGAGSQARSVSEVGSERSFVLSTAFRVASSFRRAARKRRREVDDGGLEELEAPELNPEALAEKQRLRVVLQRVLNQLPLELRAVFVLYELEELTMAEIAATLELPPAPCVAPAPRARAVRNVGVERRGGLSVMKTDRVGSNRSGGLSQRLLDSASLDKPSHARVAAAKPWPPPPALSPAPRGSSGVTDQPLARATPPHPRHLDHRRRRRQRRARPRRQHPARPPSPTARRPPPPCRSAPTSPPRPPPPPDIRRPSPPPRAPRAPWPSASSAPPGERAPRKSKPSAPPSRRGDSASAIAQLNAYDSSHPNGQLKPESMALRIQVLSNSGKTTEARTLANDFQGKYPQHPLVEQVRAAVSR